MTQRSPDKHQLLAIQYLRAIAALMVVVHHARNPQPWLWNPLGHYPAFAWGVDIFFVISGFIMYVAARDEGWREFAGKRLIRVVPLYWLATLALVVVNARHGMVLPRLGEATHLLESLLFIPHESPDRAGHIYPYLIVGWTLNYEMFFYAVFCVGIVFRRVLAVTSAIILALLAAGALFHFQNAIALTYTSPLLLEFLCGVWLGVLYRRGATRWMPAWLLPAGFIVLLALPLLLQSPAAILGMRIACGVAIVAGAIGWGARVPVIPLLKRLGDASYSLYLTHTILALLVVQAVWPRVPLHGPLQLAGYLLSALLVSAALGLAVYTWVERPITRWLRETWTARNPARRGLPATSAPGSRDGR